MTTVLHITPHLGGGVGKALSGLISQAHAEGSLARHTIVCLEQPEKQTFVERIRAADCEVIIAPKRARLHALVAAADIVQLEWWNHPATLECLCGMAPQPLRLVVWSHISGLCNPIVPPQLMEQAHRFLFTSPCSLHSGPVAALAARLGRRLDIVSSGGGFAELPGPHGNAAAPLAAAYIGSLNFAKLHPDYVAFLAAVREPGFQVRLVGDPLNREVLERQCEAAGRAEMIDFRGYASDVAAALAGVNVLAYLLNPRHYGTAENALLDAMAMGIVPVVLANPCELSIVEHRRTGIVVDSPQAFAAAIEWLIANPEERMRMGMRAASEVRTRFTLQQMCKDFGRHYCEVLREDKRHIRFENIFGQAPDRWFLSCQGDPSIFQPDGRLALPNWQTPPADLLETTKGSVLHFYRYFPENARLAAWSEALMARQSESISS